MSHPFAAQDRAVYGMGFYRAHVVGFPDRQRALRDLGFVWERLQPEYNLVVEALAAFRDVFGHLLVPSAFVVPSGDPAWPPGTAGLPLGRRARQIRRRLDHVAGDERRCRQLDELGFVWDPARHRAGKGSGGSARRAKRDAEAAAADAGAAEETKEGDAADVEAPPEPEPEPEPPADDGVVAGEEEEEEEARDDAEETPAEETEPETEGARELRRLQKEERRRRRREAEARERRRARRRRAARAGLRAADDDDGDDGGDGAARDDRRRRRRRARDRRRDRRRLRDDDDDDDDDYWARRLPPAAAEPRARPRLEPLDAPTDDQRRMANHLALQGHRVELRGPRARRGGRDADRHGGSRGSRDFRGDRGAATRRSRRRRRCSAATTTRASRRGRARRRPRGPGAPAATTAATAAATTPLRDGALPAPAPAADEAGFPDTPPRFFRDYRRRDFDDDRHRYRSNPPSPYGADPSTASRRPAPLRVPRLSARGGAVAASTAASGPEWCL
ncbi:hypothetical protein JL720_7176 [Aureococcus anophagefferens]|nr:hypothetical protein JL720_7176 [Aureococcus anophagefferens]